MMSKLSDSGVRGPKFIVPRHSGLTFRPVRPSARYVIAEVISRTLCADGVAPYPTDHAWPLRVRHDTECRLASVGLAVRGSPGPQCFDGRLGEGAVDWPAESDPAVARQPDDEG